MFTMFTGFLPLGETVEWEAFFASHKLQKKKKKKPTAIKVRDSLAN